MQKKGDIMEGYILQSLIPRKLSYPEFMSFVEREFPKQNRHSIEIRPHDQSIYGECYLVNVCYEFENWDEFQSFTQTLPRELNVVNILPGYPDNYRKKTS